jgi:hypothetical protein
MLRLPAMKLSQTLALCLLLLLAAAARHAAAEPRRHDGFYLRLGAGGGYALGTLSTASDSDSQGPNVASELAIGYAIRPGLVVGGGTFPMVVPSPSYDGIDAGGQHVSGTGLFADYYLDPAGGLHLQAALLFAAGYLDGGQREGKVGVGYGGMLGAGYDLFVSDEWSLGALARLTVYGLFGVDDRIRLVSPSLLFTATFN